MSYSFKKLTTIKLFTQAIAAVALFVVGGISSAQASNNHENTLSLDGTWQIIFDKQNESRGQKLHLNKPFLARKDIKNIDVPSVWERIEEDYEGVAIYRRTFSAPKTWQGKIAHIAFDAVNYRAEVYLNDNVVGVHEGGFTPFSFRIDSMLNFDKENVITVRVLGPIILDTDKVIDGMGAMETPQWRGAITGGIWQSVRLVATEKSYISDLFIETSVKNSNAKITLSTTNFGPLTSTDTLEITIAESKTNKVVAKQSSTIVLIAGKNKWSGTVGIPNAKLWSPESPNLYNIKVTLTRDGKISDAVTDRFGVREFTVKNKRFHLNGEEVYVKAVFLEGVYPVGIATPFSLDLARKEITMAKEAGFNMIRPWRRPPPPAWLDLADEMGVFVIGSPAVECMDLPISTPDLPNRINFEIKETILRDRNRASIVLWELFNEVRRPVLKQMMAETAMMARDADPSRLILDESGGWAFGAKVYLPYSRDFVKFNDVHTYPGPNVSNEWYDKFLGVSYTKEERKALNIKGKPIGHNLQEGATTFVSELGYGSFVDFDIVNARFAKEGNPIAPATRYHAKLGSQLTEVLSSQLADIYPTPQDFYHEQQVIHGKANARMIEATRANPKITGYCVHALTGGDWIMGAGLLDLWRNPKPAVYNRTKAANQARILTIRTFPRTANVGEEVRFTVKGINDLADVKGQLKVTVTDQADKVIWSKAADITLKHAISDLLEHTLKTDKLLGTYTVKAEVIASDGKTIATNSFAFDVFDNSTHGEIGNFAVVDQTRKMVKFFKKNSLNFEQFNDNTSIDTPVFVAMAIWPNDKQVAVNIKLSEFAKKGGTVTYVQFPRNGQKIIDGSFTKGSAANMPINFGIKSSTGYWNSMSHIVTDHAVFKGLPINKVMQGIYENVRAKETIVDLDAKPIVYVLANDNFPDMALMKRHYIGPGDVWSGSDLSAVKHGKGKLVLSTMQVVDNLSTDPVADKIMLNLLSYFTD